MVAPTIPTSKPPIWASLVNYSVGPDITTPTKVDSTSVAPNGHIPGKDFASTGPEQNDWQNLTAIVAAFLFDSLGAGASPNGAEDRRVMITDDDGFIALTGIHLLGSTALVAPTLLIDGSPSGSPCIDVTTNISDDPGLLIRAGSIGTDGFLAELLDPAGEASGMNIEVFDPTVAGFQVLIDSAENAGDGLAILGHGGDGSLAEAGGTGVVGIGGSDGGGGPGIGVFAASTSAAGIAIHGVNAGATDQDIPAVLGQGLDNGDGLHGVAVDGHACKLESLGNGSPLVLVPKLVDPTDSNSPSGMVWLRNKVTAADQTDIRVQLGPSSTGDQRWVATYLDQHCRTMGFFAGPHESTGPEVAIVENFQFPLGNRPQDTNTFVLFTLSFTMTRDTDSVDGDDAFVGRIKIIDVGAGAIEVLSKALSISSHFVEIGSPSAGTAITWGDRKQANFFQQVVLRKQYTLPNPGAQNFDVTFTADANLVGKLILSDVALEIETVA